MANQKSPKIAKNIFCKICDYNTSKTSDYSKHLATLKHKRLIMTNENLQKSPDNCQIHIFSCICSKQYQHMSSLCKHKKTCESCNSNTTETNMIDKLVIENKNLKEFMIEQNQDFKSLILEILKKDASIIGNINNNTINNNISNNCNNKSFNLNVFLNEKCKDAMNMSEFVDTIKMQLSDLENFAHLGYADGVSKIFVQGINALDIHLRPIHCSDSKRETLYIKDNDEWVKETDDKPLIINAIKKVAFKNIKQINEWIKENPECKDPRTKKYDKYNKIVMNAMSGGTIEEQQDNIEKIVKNVTKAVAIEKYALR